MEGKNDTEDSPGGMCNKLFNYLTEGFPLCSIRQINQGREGKATAKATAGPELVPATALAVPVEHLEMMFPPKSGVSEDAGKKRRDESATSTTKKIAGDGIHGATFVEMAKKSDKLEQLKKSSAAQPQPQPQEEENNNPQVKILRPRKPVTLRAASNIDEKSSLFIQKKKESFASQ